MIRETQKEETDKLVNIWLEASIIAHNFIPEEYWKSKVEDMKNIYLPMSKSYVYVDDDSNDVLGFISLIDTYIAAIFVSPKHQRKGLGKALLNHAKESFNSLELSVYSENKNSVYFYQSQNFMILEERIDENTGHQELVMKYQKD